jgi:hypothetical protein
VITLINQVSDSIIAYPSGNSSNYDIVHTFS